MKVDELKKNGSGYNDPTAYKAMKNFENGGVSNMTINKGEIWEVEHGKYIKSAIVIANHGSYCSVLMLDDDYRESRNIQINAHGIKYTESGFVQYKFNNAFVSFIRVLTDAEFKDVCTKVAKSLDLPVAVSDEDYFEKLLTDKNEEIEMLKAELEEAKTRILNFETEPFVADIRDIEENIVLKTERDLYKKQYEMLLERLIGA